MKTLLVVGSFIEVSGLSIEVEQVATVCPKGGGDCDDNAWEKACTPGPVGRGRCGR